jgi:hypothetical protein
MISCKKYSCTGTVVNGEPTVIKKIAHSVRSDLVRTGYRNFFRRPGQKVPDPQHSRGVSHACNVEPVNFVRTCQCHICRAVCRSGTGLSHERELSAEVDIPRSCSPSTGLSYFKQVFQTPIRIKQIDSTVVFVMFQCLFPTLTSILKIKQTKEVMYKFNLSVTAKLGTDPHWKKYAETERIRMETHPDPK